MIDDVVNVWFSPRLSSSCFLNLDIRVVPHVTEKGDDCFDSASRRTGWLQGNGKAGRLSNAHIELSPQNTTSITTTRGSTHNCERIPNRTDALIYIAGTLSTQQDHDTISINSIGEMSYHYDDPVIDARRSRPDYSYNRSSTQVTLKSNARQKQQQLQQQQVTSIVKYDRKSRFCPAGHFFHRVPLTLRQRSLQVEQRLPAHIIPPITCNGCSRDIFDENIAGCCRVCDLDFCEPCYASDIPIEDLIEHGMMNLEIEVDPTVSGSMVSEMTMSMTAEKCALGHPLCRVLTIRRKRYLQERDGLEFAPMIECNCCSRVIRTEHIAGCCVSCDIDFCQDCFQNGQSFEDILQEEPELVDADEPGSAYGDRYNTKRPTYKRTGRVSYDDYPDPTVYQWEFTGSNESDGVEFFEKDYGTKLGIVKLDFFFANGKIRTLLDHRKKGLRPLFVKNDKISSKLYRKILQDPRRYAMKALKNIKM